MTGLLLLLCVQLLAHNHSHGFHLTVLDHFYHVNPSSQGLTKVDGGIQ
jgi:hypothetical protein